MPLLSILALVAFGLVFAACGVGVIWWALFRDKARGRRRCPKCWHDLSRTPGLVCGECGRVARSESEFLRTRRRWGVATVALVIVLAVTGWTRLEVTSAGWASLLPSSVLTTLVAYTEPPSSLNEGWRELARRMRRRTLSGDAQLALAENLASLRDGPTLRTAPAELLQQLLQTRPPEFDEFDDMTPLQRRAVTDAYRDYRAALDTALAKIPITASTRIPAEWSADVPLTVTVRGVLWGPRTEWRVRVARARANPVDDAGTATGPQVELRTIGDAWLVWSAAGGLSGYGPPAAVLEVESPPKGRHAVSVDLAFETRRWDWTADTWGEWLAVDGAQAAQEVDVGAVAPVRPVNSAAVVQAMHAAFEARAISWLDDTRPIGVRSDPSAFAQAEFSDLLVGVVLELCEHGEPRRRLRFWWRGGSLGRGRVDTWWATEYEDVPALLRLREDATGWTLRVRGDPATALRALPANPAPDETSWRAWNGSFEVPLEVSSPREPAPNRTWRREPR